MKEQFVIRNESNKLYRSRRGTWVLKVDAKRYDQDQARRVCLSLADSGECDLDDSRVETA